MTIVPVRFSSGSGFSLSILSGSESIVAEITSHPRLASASIAAFSFVSLSIGSLITTSLSIFSESLVSLSVAFETIASESITYLRLASENHFL